MLALTQKKWMPRAWPSSASSSRACRPARFAGSVRTAGIEQRRSEHPRSTEQTMGLGHAERLSGRVRLDDVARVGAADVRAERAGQTVGVVAVQEVVAVAGPRVVGVRRQNQRRAARPSSDASRRQPDHVAGVFRARAPDGFAFHELPEPRDILLELAVDDVGAVDAEIAQPLVTRDRGWPAEAAPRHGPVPPARPASAE